MSISLDDIIGAALELERDTKRKARRNGPPKQQFCKEGHDLAVHGRQQYKTKPDGTTVKNGRDCMECKRIAQRTPGAAPRPNAQKPRRPAGEIAARPSRRGKKQKRVSGNAA